MAKISTRPPTILNPNPGLTEEQKLELMENGDYEFAHNDGNEVLLSRKGLGLINWCSSWSMANLFRYSHAASTVLKHANKNGIKCVKVLDIGCSAATFAVFWKTAYQPPVKCAIDYIGFEVDDGRIERGLEAVKPARDSAKKWAQVIKHDLVVEPLAQGLPPGWRPDVIIAQEVIEHVGQEAARRLLQEAHSLLADSGTLLISTPAPKKEQGENWVWPESHAYEFSGEELESLVQEHGFEVTHRAGWFSQGKDRTGKNALPAGAKKLYRELSVLSPAVAASVIGFLHPEHATCVTLTLKKV